MASEARKQDSMSVKSLVKYLSKFCTIEISDTTNPTSEKTMDIFYQLACHLFGEEVINRSLRGYTSKSVCLSIQLHALFNDILPNFKPPYTMTDFISPTKQRTVVLLTALARLIQVDESHSHIRERFLNEKEQLEGEQQQLLQKMVETHDEIVRVRELNGRLRDESNRLQDNYLCFESERAALSALCDKTRAESENFKTLIQDTETSTKNKEQEVRKLTERIAYLESNILPPRAEFEERLRELAQADEDADDMMKDKACRTKKANEKTQSLLGCKTEGETAFRLLQKCRDAQLTHKQKTEELNKTAKVLLEEEEEFMKEIDKFNSETLASKQADSVEVENLLAGHREKEAEGEHIESCLKDVKKQQKISNAETQKYTLKHDKARELLNKLEKDFQSLELMENQYYEDLRMKREFLRPDMKDISNTINNIDN